MVVVYGVVFGVILMAPLPDPLRVSYQRRVKPPSVKQPSITLRYNMQLQSTYNTATVRTDD